MFSRRFFSPHPEPLTQLDPDFYDVDTLRKTTKYRHLLRQFDNKESDLELLADELTEVCRKYPLTRSNMIRTWGKCALERRAEIERIFKETVGAKCDWKIVSVNYSLLENGGPVGKFFAIFFFMTPQIWIRIAI